jgi:hypothetical protein
MCFTKPLIVSVVTQGKALLLVNYCVDPGLRPRCSDSNSLIAGPYPIQNRSQVGWWGCLWRLQTSVAISVVTSPVRIWGLRRHSRPHHIFTSFLFPLFCCEWYAHRCRKLERKQCRSWNCSCFFPFFFPPFHPLECLNWFCFGRTISIIGSFCFLKGFRHCDSATVGWIQTHLLGSFSSGQDFSNGERPER